jgi:RNase P/RNase MRP subunit p30
MAMASRWRLPAARNLAAVKRTIEAQWTSRSMAYLNPRSLAAKIEDPGQGRDDARRRDDTQEIVAMERGKEEMARGSQDRRDYDPLIFTRGGGLFSKCQKIGKVFWVLLEMSFSHFSQKSWIGKIYWVLLEML